MRSKIGFVVAGLMGLATAGSAAWADPVYDSGGFESARFSATATNSNDPTVIGNLRAQDSAVNQWRQFGVANGYAISTAAVAAGAGFSGQGVVLTRTGGAASADNRWSPLYNVTPSFPTAHVIEVSWRMKVAQSVGANYGPFFGVETDSTTAQRTGMFGVDANTGEVLFLDPTQGFQPTPGGETVSFGAWNQFKISVDYNTKTYSGSLNGTTVLANVPFSDNSASNFGQAYMAGLFAGGLTEGTATFDDYVVTAVPEPGCGLLLMGVAGLFLSRRRSRSNQA